MTLDNFLFTTVSYWHDLPFDEMLQFSSKSYFLGLVFEWATIPFIIFASAKLKKIEHIDIFDINTNFTPFSLEVNYNDQNDRYFDFDQKTSGKPLRVAGKI